jgi:hypothetical protein
MPIPPNSVTYNLAIHVSKRQNRPEAADKSRAVERVVIVFSPTNQGLSMSGMVERVARAICRAGICGPRSHLDQQENENWRSFKIEARAAISAMREPTQAMVDAVYIDPGFCDEPGVPSPPDDVWRQMIDEALKT